MEGGGGGPGKTGSSERRVQGEKGSSERRVEGPGRRGVLLVEWGG